MADALYHKFVKRWEEVTDLPPQTVGPLTPYYKRAVRHLKIMPWPALVAAAVVTVVAIYLVIGSAITIVTSILQKGF
jgi:hypothetical protein